MSDALERVAREFDLTPASDAAAWQVAADRVEELGDELTAALMRGNPCDLRDAANVSGSGSGYGDGYGDGYGSGYGDGDGSGYGYGSGSGYGDGYGSGYGCGYGSGYGDGSGSGYGSGYGDGDGDGYGDGDGGNWPWRDPAARSRQWTRRNRRRRSSHSRTGRWRSRRRAGGRG
jgi:hypothetical protein